MQCVLLCSYLYMCALILETTAYQSSPAHIELFLEEAEGGVKKVVDEEDEPRKKTVSKKKQARERARQGIQMAD